MKKVKNSITTCGYFLRRLRESGYIVIRLFSGYGQADTRKWTVMVDPGGVSLQITCHINRDYRGDVSFEFNDGGNKFKNYYLKTKSMEIVVSTIFEKNITPKDDNSLFIKKD